MGRNICIWALIGLFVACCWAVVGIALGPGYNLGRSTIVSITAPASFLGRGFPLTVYGFAFLNAAVYAVVGLGAELFRQHHR
jgi:hypothetical protein